MTRRILIALALIGCGTPAAPVPVAEPAAATRPVVIEEPADDLDRFDPDPPDPNQPGTPLPALSDAELDAMEHSEIEAACFAGSTAACDRLGH